MTGKMMLELHEVTQELKQWRHGKLVLLKGKSKQFCSGGDLKNFMNYLKTPELGYMMSCFMHYTMKDFSKLPMSTIALIEGQTLGGGAEITTACDYRLMEKSASIGFVQSKLGITPGWGGATRLSQIVGSRNAMELLLSGRRLSPNDAIQLQLVDKTFDGNREDQEDAVDFAIQWVEENGLLSLSPSLTQEICKLMKEGKPNQDKSFQSERELFGRVWQGNEHLSALSKKIKHRK
ncbi:ethylmalonyl-CoA decarboxylase-like [Clytia hemisphaerica]|uniref:Ethylmalonyl-CoA decarboxylase n=1 Tax=Clytia hemisphaerica TaxID=252671 RepID=A0A7M5X6Q8_9CNID